MPDLSIEEYRRLHRTLGGHPDDFERWLALHREWEAQRRAELEKPPKHKKTAENGAK